MALAMAAREPEQGRPRDRGEIDRRADTAIHRDLADSAAQEFHRGRRRVMNSSESIGQYTCITAKM
jgi:hypothetical protein